AERMSRHGRAMEMLEQHQGRTRSCPMGTSSGPAGHHGTEPRLRHRVSRDGHTLAAPPPAPPLRAQQHPPPPSSVFCADHGGSTCPSQGPPAWA
ncbi:hypothetical protein PIB30_115481, partial [Stylosanthes scabra]|nr:hypothetical protein [Stylosanthes scabra]